MVKLNFQCHMILQKSLGADSMLKKHLLLLSVLKTVVLPNIFCGNHDTFSKCIKEQHLPEFEIIIVFTVAFGQYNASHAK